VLKAVSSPVRLKILNLLIDRGSLSYTEIMGLLKLSPSRDAGRFAYHLKMLLKMDLIEPDVETKKYRLTPLGRMVVDLADEIEASAMEKKRMLVRTSRLAIEPFDRNKIAESLVREADVPMDLAQRIARETEKRLQKLRTKYLTAPLIREFVNALLIERGLEEYRHKLTRLGLPVYDVTQVIKSMSTQVSNVEAVHKSAGDAVIEEYSLLNILPRDIADAHLSGILHLNNLGSWILKPNEFMHDLRFFFRYGLNFEAPGLMIVSSHPPESFESALSSVTNILRLAATEISGEQTIDFFNVFLAPYAQSLKPEEIKKHLSLFLIDVNHAVPSGVSLGIEPIIPEFLAESEAYGPHGELIGKYRDFLDGSRLIASSLLEVMLERGGTKPILNPSPIIKVRQEAFKDEEGERLLYEAHRLAAEKGMPYFANLSSKKQMDASYSATGLRLAADWRGDWELDAIRTGSMDSVIIDLPRAFYDAGGDRNKFYSCLNERLEMALRALEIKFQIIRQRLREGLLPFLARREGEDSYYRIENSSRLVSFVGLNETVLSMDGKAINEDDKALNSAAEILKYLSKVIGEYIKKTEARFVLSMVPCAEAAKRLAQLDIEKYGWARVHIQGDKKNPSYTNMTALPREAKIPLKEYLNIEGRFHQLALGSHLATITIEGSDRDPERLLQTTREILNTYKIGLYAYDMGLTYCSNCKKAFIGELDKCPSCGSVNAITQYCRGPAKYTVKHFGSR